VIDVVNTLLSAAVGALLWTSVCRRKAKPAKPVWVPFEPGICDTLPEHPWSWDLKEKAYRCPMCTGLNGGVGPAKQQPYCDERGGHFHWKCRECGYEWAMGTWDRTVVAEKEREAKKRAKEEEEGRRATAVPGTVSTGTVGPTGPQS
jgi:hypothetical protein